MVKGEHLPPHGKRENYDKEKMVVNACMII